jgi:AhpC/TSA family
VPILSTPVTPRVNPTKVADGPLTVPTPPVISIPNQFAPKPEKKELKDGELPAVPPKGELPSPSVIPAPKEPAKSEKPPLSDGAQAPDPSAATPTNSCVLVGKRLEDFTLLNLAGNPWQFKRDHKGQVVLLDFWSTRNDLAHVHQLRDLQTVYGSYGLEVVGIAYEDGTLNEQVRNVRPVRGRYTINYTTILGGPVDTCQVKKQFDVTQFPTLILLDEQGKIIYRADLSEKTQLQELEAEIRKQLGVKDTLPRAGQ